MSDARSRKIALVLASIHTGASNELWSEIAHLARLSHTSLFVFPGGRLECEENQEYLRNAIYSLVNSDTVEGVLVWASALAGSVRVEDVQDFLETLGPLPSVSIGLKREGYPTVSFDAYAGVQSIILHCITKHKSRRIAFIRGPENHYSAQDRYRAYCDTLDQTGLVLDPRLVSDPHPWTEGAAALSQLVEQRGLKPGKDFDTLACSSDLMMFAAGKQLEALGYSIPGDVRIVGYNDSSESHLLRVPCTTARMPVTELAHMSFNLLSDLLEDGSGPSFDILLPSHPVIRQSCGCTYSLGSPEQARQSVGTPSLFFAWLMQSFRVPESESRNIQRLLDEADSEDEQACLGLVQELVHRFLYRGGDPNLLSEALHWYCTFFASSSFKEQRACALRDLFLRQRDLVAHQHAYALSMQAKHLDALKCDLLGVRNITSIPALLATHLGTLGLEAGYLVLYEDDEKSTYIGGYDNDMLLEEKQTFAKHLLLPQAIQEKLVEGVYVVEPLFMDNQPLGYLVIRTTLFSGSVMEELRTALSSAIKGTFLLDAANKAREEAERAQRARTEFFANISEGLRNPLESILLLVQDKDEALRDQVEEQLRTASHLLDLTLSYTGAFELERTIFNPSDLLFSLKISHSFTYEGEPDLPVLQGDRAKLLQAFEIVLQYIQKQGGRVTIKTELQNPGLQFSFISSQVAWKASMGNQDPSLSLAQRIIVMSGGLVSMKDNQIIFRLGWPSLEGESLARPSSTLTYIGGEQENEVPPLFSAFDHVRLLSSSSLNKQNLAQLEGSLLGWDGRRSSAELQLALYLLAHHPLLSKAPMVCYHAPPGYESLASSLVSSKSGNQEDGVLVLMGSLGHSLAGELGMMDNVVLCARQEIEEVYANNKVRLLISDIFDPALYERLRRISPSPIVILREHWTHEEAEQLSLIPRLIIAHRFVMESSEFLARIVTLLTHQEVLPPLTGALVKRAIVYLGEHATTPISRWQLAEAVNVSEDYLTRIFRKEIGLSPWDYLNRQRIHLATNLLKQSTLTINEVASQTGFHDQAYFCRVFRKIKGMAPTKVRSSTP